jgi:hypothetical protein
MNNRQDSLNLLIRNYTEEYAALLERAVAGHYHRLYENFLALADLYTVLLRLAAVEGRTLEIPSPLLILDRDALVALGYSGQRLSRLEQFFHWVQRIYHEDFPALLKNRLNFTLPRAA